MRRACLDCGARAEPGSNRCAKHQQTRQAAVSKRRNAKRDSLGVSRRAWRRLRDVAIERAGGRCRLALHPLCTGLAESVHLDPSFRGDHAALLALHEDEALEHVTPACRYCHGAIDGGRSRGGAGADPDAPYRDPYREPEWWEQPGKPPA